MFKHFSKKDYKKMAVLHLVAIFFVIIDRLLKVWAKTTKPLADGAFSFNYSFNSNLAFSLPLGHVLIMVVSGLIIAGLWLYYFKLFREGRLAAGFVGALIFGALSNYFDRLVYGGVIDYFNFSFLFIFNLADALITFSLLGWFVLEITNNNRPITTSQTKL